MKLYWKGKAGLVKYGRKDSMELLPEPTGALGGCIITQQQYEDCSEMSDINLCSFSCVSFCGCRFTSWAHILSLFTYPLTIHQCIFFIFPLNFSLLVSILLPLLCNVYLYLLHIAEPVRFTYFKIVSDHRTFYYVIVSMFLAFNCQCSIFQCIVSFSSPQLHQALILWRPIAVLVLIASDKGPWQIQWEQHRSVGKYQDTRQLGREVRSVKEQEQRSPKEPLRLQKAV